MKTPANDVTVFGWASEILKRLKEEADKVSHTEELQVEVKSEEAKKRLEQSIPNVIKAVDNSDMKMQFRLANGYPRGQTYAVTVIEQKLRICEMTFQIGHVPAEDRVALMHPDVPAKLEPINEENIILHIYHSLYG